MTQETTVVITRINLKRDTEMSTGYRGRGLPSLTRTFPAGTRVTYQQLHYKGAYVAHDGDEITAIRHVVSAHYEGDRYSSSKTFELKKEGDDGKTEEADL